MPSRRAARAWVVFQARTAAAIAIMAFDRMVMFAVSSRLSSRASQTLA